MNNTNFEKPVIPCVRVRYSVVCEHFPTPTTYFDTPDMAIHWAKFDQPNDKPHYVIKCTEHYELRETINE